MTNNERRDALVKQLTEHQLKYTYFILAINASAIGYSVQLPISEINKINILLLFSLIFWGISFYCGCTYLLNQMSIRHGEIMIHDDPNNIVIKRAMDLLNNKGGLKFKLSFYSLIAGVTIFIVWHFIKIIYPSLGI